MISQASYEISKENPMSTSFKNTFGTPARRGICAVFLIFILFIAFVSIYIYFKDKPLRSEDILTNFVFEPFIQLNTSVDPCVNFYEFTCGKKNENDTSSDALHTLGDLVEKKKQNIFVSSKPSEHFPRVVNDAFEFYGNCLKSQFQNTSDSAFLLEYLDGFGGWPILNKSAWQETNFDWIQASIYLQKTLGIETFFGIYSTHEDTNSSSFILYIKPPTFIANDKQLKFAHNQGILNLILYTLNPNIEDEIIEDIEELNNTETVWRHLFSFTEKPDPVKLSVKDLQTKLPQFDWLYYFQSVTNDSLNREGEKITNDNLVMIESLVYLENVISVFQSNNFSKMEVANLFGWLVVQDVDILIPGFLLNYADSFEYEPEETEELVQNNCFQKTFEIYECSIEYLYVQNVTDFDLKSSRKLIRYLEHAYRNAISSSWLDEHTKIEALSKLSSLQTILGYKNYLTNKAEFDKVYKDIPRVTKNDIETYFKIKSYYVSLGFYRLKFKNDLLNQSLPRAVTDVSAYYVVNQNVLAIPISLFSPPIYFNNGPGYLNFGALGWIMSHEIMHAFDNVGLKYDAKGNLRKWWSNTSLDEYSRRADCFEKQYSIYTNSSSVATINENIADSEGLQMAYNAYKLWIKDHLERSTYLSLKEYSADQMFFISFGAIWCAHWDVDYQSLRKRVHSSPNLRVIGSISNSESFALAFKCAKDSPMNPYDKCHIW